MAYASIQDMIDRFGQVEMIRLTTPADQDMDTVQAYPVLRALEVASAKIDGYLRRRYAVPLELVPAEVQDAACRLARYDLSTGDNREASERATQDRKDTIAWLTQIAKGEVLLPLSEVAPGDESFAQVRTRRPMFGGEFGASTFPNDLP